MIYPILVSFASIIIYLLVFKHNHNMKYMMWLLVLNVYLIGLISQVVGFPSISGMLQTLHFHEKIFSPTFSFIPFTEGLNIFGILNIIVFIPLGMFAKYLWNSKFSLKESLILGLATSLIIEVGQMFARFRVTDVEDLILNTLGTVIGYLIIKYIFRKKFSQEFKTIDLIFVLAISFISCFLVSTLTI